MQSEASQSSGAARNKQVAGNHYKDMPIQPTEYIVANGIGWLEANAIKYISRHHVKNGEHDLDKAIHYIEWAKEEYYDSSSK